MTDLLSAETIREMTGYKRPADQLRELHRRGFYRARIAKVTRDVIVERPHYEAVISGRQSAPAAPITFPLTKARSGPRAAFPWAKRTALYRHFDKAGALLYVGIAVDPAKRTSSHQAEAAWAKKIARVEVEWFETRRDAMTAERKAISDEAPKFNLLRYTRSTQ